METKTVIKLFAFNYNEYSTEYIEGKLEGLIADGWIILTCVALIENRTFVYTCSREEAVVEH